MQKRSLKLNIKIIVATHRPYRMPADDIYLPLHVGKNGAEGFGLTGDDTGDNISHKNPYFCELTGIYWAWKNLEADYVGLSHYRRQFSVKPKNECFDCVLTGQQACALLEKNDVLLPKRQRYYIENLYSHYAHTHTEEHLKVLREVILEKCPQYLESFENLKKRTSAHMFNMFVMKREVFNEYCQWLFDVLFEIENRIDTSGLNSFDSRLFGRLGELLLDIWIEKNGIAYREIPYVYMEKINYAKKIRAFLKAKFFGKRYDKSF